PKTIFGATTPTAFTPKKLMPHWWVAAAPHLSGSYHLKKEIHSVLKQLDGSPFASQSSTHRRVSRNFPDRI
ncbi:hypothetical protein, partial [Suipraeoptans intestinalis]|uniref:hypothetical protein n=1 Tax=Suipraeoptans intestinalis TaxID=2606628 RepID=UPI0023F032D6